MSTCKHVGQLFCIGIGVWALTGMLGTTSLAAPIPLAEWAKPLEPYLPKVPPEVISEVKGILAFQGVNFEIRERSDIKSQFEKNERRLVELQEQGDQAIIWLYLKDTGIPGANSGWLSLVHCNRPLAAWLLPVIRFRIEWFKQAIHDPKWRKYIQRIYRNTELSDIEGYLAAQGEFSDIENLNILTDESAKLGFELDFNSGIKSSIAEQVKSMKETRELVERFHDRPNWQGRAQNLIEKGILDADALTPRPPAHNPADGSYRPEPLGPRKPLPDITPPGPFLQPWMVWPVWLFIIVLSAGLLRWVFRKPKCASDKGELRLG